MTKIEQSNSSDPDEDKQAKDTSGKTSWPDELAVRQAEQRERATELRGGDYGSMSATESARAHRSKLESDSTIRKDHPPVTIPGEAQIAPEEAKRNKLEAAKIQDELNRRSAPKPNRPELKYEGTLESEETRVNDALQAFTDRAPKDRPLLEPYQRDKQS